MKTRRSAFAATLITLLVVLVAILGPVQAQGLNRSTSQRVMKSVVQLIATRVSPSGLSQPLWGGSGTIISADGLILTNCHVAFPSAMSEDPEDEYDELVVSLTVRSDQPPKPTYIAEVMQYDPVLDLAVIRISRTIDGMPVDRSTLNLPALALGDSDEIELGDPLFVFGYPGIGGDTITFTSGSISGFNSERGVTGRAWIKTDAAITGGNSGGTGVNDQGQLVGVPTQGGAGNADTIVDCRPVADTNGDGSIDESDTCVPFGGFINALRPVNLAKPLIDAASRGLGPQPTPQAQPTPQVVTGRPRFSHVFFAPAVNDDDQAVTVVSSFPRGTEDIYVLFDYENLADGALFQPLLSYNGVREEDVWPAANWNGGASGQWWFAVSDNPLADGTYEFAVEYGGQEYPLGKVAVGGPVQTVPGFSNITFEADGSGGYLFPVGAKQVVATFGYANMTPQISWSYQLYHDGQAALKGDGKPLTRVSGTAVVTFTNNQGMTAGTYRLELYAQARLAAVSDFTLAGGEQVSGNQSVFGPITFAEAVDSADRPVRPGTSFRRGITQVYGVMKYQGMQDGWEWGRRWYIDDSLALEQYDTWSLGQSGDFWVNVNSSSGLPEGSYLLEMLVGEQVVQQGAFTVGAVTARPTPTPTRVPAGKGVEIYGQITDADTDEGIPGATFLVLQPGITLDTFEMTDAEVYAYGTADRNGNYRLSKLLLRGETYSFLIGADGYQSLGEDDITVGEGIESPFELDITLQPVF